MLQRLRLWGGAILLVIVINTGAQGEPSAIDQGWRRTAQGWELLDARPVVAVAAPVHAPAYLHPLILAALQVAVVAAAYRRFPVKQ